MHPVEIRIDPLFHKRYEKIKNSNKFEDIEIWGHIEDALEKIRFSPTYGKHIAKDRCNHILNKHGINNLWAMKMKNGWRTLDFGPIFCLF